MADAYVWYSKREGKRKKANKRRWGTDATCQDVIREEGGVAGSGVKNRDGLINSEGLIISKDVRGQMDIFLLAAIRQVGNTRTEAY